MTVNYQHKPGNASTAAPPPRLRLALCRWFALAVIVLAAAGGAPVAAHGATVILADEYRVKAEYLFRFLAYVEWPEEAGAENGNDLVIGYRGDDALKQALQTIEGRPAGNRRVTLRAVRDSGGLKGCRIIFIGGGTRGLDQLLAAAREHHVLTVSDRRGFTRAGGIIGFVMRGANIRFEVNNQAARQAGLQISSHLLKLATDVIE